MKHLVSTKQFRRDIKLAQRRGKNLSKLRGVILLLIEGATLQQRYKDHSLKRRLEAPPRLSHRARLAAALQDRWRNFVFGAHRNTFGFVLRYALATFAILRRPMTMRFLPLSILLLLATAHADIVTDVRISLESQAFAHADSQLVTYRAQHGVTPQYIEAYSWIGRAYLKSNNLDQANIYANKTEQLAVQQLKTRKLDAEPSLPTALGAAIEVEAQVLAAKGARAQAAALLKKNLLAYHNTSIRNRLQKNLNLLALVGKPAPPLQLGEYLGPKPVALKQLKGSPVLLFFWAHWCLDCKGEAPILGRLHSEYASKGLAVIAATQRYGIAAAGEAASPSAELAYIKDTRDRYYSALLDVPAPVSAENLSVYGVSTTPTLVLLDRAGKVAFYHPGALSYEELRGAIDRAFLPSAAASKTP